MPPKHDAFSLQLKPQIISINLWLCSILAGLGFSLDPGIYQSLTALPLLYLLPHSAQTNISYKTSLTSGVLFYTCIFFWLPQTIHTYFKISSTLSLFYFLLFITVTAIQFPLALFLFRTLAANKFLPTFICYPLAWLSIEICYPRYTGGSISNLLSNTSFSNTVQLWGEYGLTFFFLLIAALITNKRIVATLILLSLTYFYSKQVETSTLRAMSTAPHINALLVQGNFAADREIINPLDTVQKLRSLTYQAVTKNEIDLVIWPESSFLFDNALNIEKILPGDINDPFPGLHIPILYGTQSVIKDNSYYNSSLIKLPTGEISGQYFKRNLFPFTEYNPISNTFFTENYTFIPGPPQQSLIKVGNFSIGIMLCYDDLWPFEILHYGHESTPKVLVSQLNDMWFASEIAQKQHALLASFRAKEHGLSLLRATNSGLTIAYDPLGRTHTALEPFNADVLLVKDIPLLRETSIFAKYGATILRLTSFISLLIACTTLTYRFFHTFS